MRLPLERAALVVGVIALAVAGSAAVTGGADAFFRSYLMSYTFWLGFGLGSMGIVFIQFLTGGNWGFATRRIFEAAAGTLPLMALLFVPLLFGIPNLYAWARPEDVVADSVLQHKAIYLNVPFFIARTVFYLAVWALLAYLLRRYSLVQDREPLAIRRLQKFSILGVVTLGLTVSFAAIDWLMSLEADWYSTMYPPLVVMGFMLASLAFGILTMIVLAPRSEIGDIVRPQLLNDLGSLLLAFVMLWAYMEYFQYMLIWAGNLTDEIPWYLRRVSGSWLSVAVALGALGFFVPFWLLLFRPLKRNPRTLAAIACLVLAMHLVDTYWLVEPPFAPSGPVFGWLDLATLVGLGAVWWVTFAWQLRARPLLAPSDPRLGRVLEAAREPA